MNKNIGSLSVADIQDIHHQYSIHGKDGDIKENFGIVAILDVLGWKQNASEKTIKEYFHIINHLRSLMYDKYKRCVRDDTPPNFKITTLSDTIVILLNGSYPYCEINLFIDISDFLMYSIEKGFMFRGAISRGKYFTNILDTVFVGEPFFEAAKYAESTEWAGIIITDMLSSDLLENNSLQNLKQLNIVQYQNIPFKKSIIPCKDKLVIVPRNHEKSICPSINVELLDYKSLYRKYMGKEIVKYQNTADFINYLEQTFW